jgi:transglutaminase-like putative cysteine protease
VREANWDQIFQRREQAGAPSDERLSAIIPWEEWLTLFITTVVFLSVVQSVDSAHWVNDMPSLYPMGFAGLLCGYLLARVRWRAIWLHAIALFTGTTLVYLQLLAILPGGSPAARSDNMLDRMHIWWYAVTHNGISSDPLPFIVLTLVLLWLGTYVSSWAIFRWRNPWLGLVPAGTALMWNISFLPGQFSYAFVVFVFAAVLLVMRLHVAKKESEWDEAGVRYPEFISISVLNATLLVTAGLLAAVWLIPLADRSDTASQRWHDFTAPATERLAPFGRLFVSLNAKKPIEVHNLKDALALQGGIKLSGKEAVDINVTLTPEMAAFLRAQSFDEYTSNGWKVNIDGDVPLAPGAQTDVPQENGGGARQQVTIHVKVQGGNNGVLYSLGQPIESSAPSQARVGGASGDVSSLTPSGKLKDGSDYSTTGSVSVASIDQLRGAGTDYPSWVSDRYLEVPGSLPRRVRAKAREVTRGEPTPYDKAVAIETYLRSFPIDYSISPPPPGHDSVDYFLFDAQRGYFDYHASAMAVMLRTLGIPSRVATGYVIDSSQRQGDSNDYHLTERNAFTWPEVYFPEVGWVEFSPTPSQPTIDRPGTQLIPQPSTSTRGLQDPIDLGALAADGSATPEEIPTPQGAASAVSSDGGRDWTMWAIVAGAAAFALIAAGGARLAWDSGSRGLDEPARLWRKTQRLARWARAGGPPSETPREFAGRLQRDVRDIAPVVELAHAYERTAFGAKQISDDERDRLHDAWSAVRNRLIARAFHRA